MAWLDAFRPSAPKLPQTVRGQALAVPAGAQRIVGGASAGAVGIKALEVRVSGTQPGSWIVYLDGVGLEGLIVNGRAVANGYTQQTQPFTVIPLGGETTEPYGRIWVCVVNGSPSQAGDYECSLTFQEA